VSEKKTDIVVIGSGASGMAAALAAAEGGAEVILFESRHMTGGISNMAVEIFAVESKLQRDKNIPFTCDEAFSIFMERTRWRVDARLVRAYINKTASTIDWLQQQGIEFFDIQPFFLFPESKLAGHFVKPAGPVRPGAHGSPTRTGALATMMKILREKAKEKGIDIYVDTPVKKIIKNGNRIAGVIAEERSGQPVRVKAKAVIIASGGYVTNKEMLKKYGGFELGHDAFIKHAVKLPGEGIQMAWEVGATSDGMYPQMEFFVPAPKALDNQMTLHIVSQQPYLWINQHGERFFNEGIIGDVITVGNAVARQKNRCAYLIIDGNTKTHMEKDGLDIVPAWAADTAKDIYLDSLVKEAAEKGNENIFVADSLKELSDKIRVDSNALQNSLNEYNTFCQKGHDDLFAKNPRYLWPVKQPKFYAFKAVLNVYGTLGGIKINEKAEVINTEDEAIPGLYAAGDAANGALSHDYSIGLVLRGGTISFALNSGRIAGENALKYLAK
jgi:fumarate reductase flavoprotein subunit